MSKLLDDYLTEDEFAAEMNRSPRTVRSWREQRIGPAFTRIGREVYYRREAIHQWLLKREQGPVRGRRSHEAA